MKIVIRGQNREEIHTNKRVTDLAKQRFFKIKKQKNRALIYRTFNILQTDSDIFGINGGHKHSMHLTLQLHNVSFTFGRCHLIISPTEMRQPLNLQNYL